MHSARRAGSCRLVALALAWVVLLGGCSTVTSEITPQYVDTHGHSVDDALHVALQQAEAQCQGQEPIVLEQRVKPATPTFIADSPASSAQSETLKLAVATHEGESPAVRLGFHCSDVATAETP